jgi:hypothetical protein
LIGSVVLILAIAESAFAGFRVISWTDKAGIVFDFPRALVKVRDLLHKVFVELMFS